MKNIITILFAFTVCFSLSNLTLAQGTLGEYPGAGVGFDSGCGYPDAGNSDPGVSDANLVGNTCGSAFDSTFGPWAETAGGFDITGWELNNFDIDDEAVYGIRLFYGPQNNCCTICLDAMLDLGQGAACGTFGPQADLGAFGIPVPANYGQDVFGVADGIIPYADMCPNTEYFAQYQLISATAIDLTDPDMNGCAMDDALITNAGTQTTVQTLVAPGMRDPIVINSATLALAGAADCGATDVLLDFTADIIAGCTVSFGTCSQGLEFEFRAALVCADGAALDITTGPIINDPMGCFVGAALSGQISLGSAADVCAILECDAAASLELYTTYTFCEADDIIGDGSGNDEAVLSISIADVLTAYNDAMCCEMLMACDPYNAIVVGPACDGYQVCIGYTDDLGLDPTGGSVTVTDDSGLTPTVIDDGMTVMTFDADGDGVDDSSGFCYTVALANETCDPVPYTPLVTATCPDGTEAMYANGDVLTNYDYLAGIFTLPGGTAAYPPLVGLIASPVCPTMEDGSDAVAGFVEVFVADANGDPTATSCLVVTGDTPACETAGGDAATPIQWNPTNDPLFIALAGMDSYSCGLNATADLSFDCLECGGAVACVSDPVTATPAETCENLPFQIEIDAACVTDPSFDVYPTDGTAGVSGWIAFNYVDAAGVFTNCPAGSTANDVLANLNPPAGTAGFVFFGESNAANGGGCSPIDIGAFVNNGCEPAVIPICLLNGDVSTFVVAFDTNGDGTNDIACDVYETSVTVYPTLTVTTTPSTDCMDVTATVTTADGTDCTPTDGSATQTCTVDGDLTFDFSGAFTDPLGCSTLTAPAACSGCTGVSCEAAVVTDGAAEICDGALAAELTDWQAAVEAAQPTTAPLTGVVYSSVNDPAAPDGDVSGVTGANMGCDAADQVVYAFLGCDTTDPADGTPDTYALAGTFTLSVYPALTATDASTSPDNCGTLQIDLVSADGTVCASETQACAADGDVLSFDFSGTVTDPQGCSTLSATTAQCAGCDGGGTCSIEATVSDLVCDNMGTPEDDSDDTEVVTLTITSSGPWTAGDGTMGASGDTYTFPATATGGTLTMMFSVDGDTCDTTFTYIVVGCDTPAIPTLSQWGLMILALLMMTFGALKIGSVTLSSVRRKS